ncbi:MULTISPECIES: pyridoxamine 5'-phosphate oxidase family protein [unclassified Actinoplanes]|uniref:pyridoxamine 5'-phosphate oxidase family protein n=1 Tax=unclassified Actinoplanes TaxID=2626549 RepID=UPI0005B88B17|nr:MULTISPECIES: pyridoxamine 5'-phosphate oxidase family protein [unclassified Actinoplanes]
MPLNNPWLAGDVPDRRLPKDRLEERIRNLFSSQNMGVLATAGGQGPVATPVRYYSLDLAVMFTASPRSPKMRNIADDPRVSFGIFAPLVGLASSRGAQLFGRARVLGPGDPGQVPYWEAFRWENEHAERGRLLSEPPAETLVVLDPDRIVYTEHWLRRDGYAPRQIWRRADPGKPVRPGS